MTKKIKYGRDLYSRVLSDDELEEVVTGAPVKKAAPKDALKDILQPVKLNSSVADIGKEQAMEGSVATVATAEDVGRAKQSAADSIKAATEKKGVADKLSGIKDAAVQKLATEGVKKGGDLLFGEGSVESGAIGTGTEFAQMGFKVGGVKGAVIGGVVGGIAGGLGASAKQKAAYQAAKQKAKAEHYGNLSKIEEEKDRKIQNAMESMKSAFSKNLQSNKSVKL
jgi:hypothetical protein